MGHLPDIAGARYSGKPMEWGVPFHTTLPIQRWACVLLKAPMAGRGDQFTPSVGVNFL